MMKFPLNLSFIPLVASIFINGCDSGYKTEKIEVHPPIAEKIPQELTLHGETRIDPYYWMRLSDQQKNAPEPDRQTRKVLDYLQAENAYKDSVLADTKPLQEKLFQEIIGRIKQDDSSVPYFKNGYWYYTRFEEGDEYPVYCRKKENLDAQEEILLDVNELALGYDYYWAGSISVSPDNNLMTYAEDTLSRRICTIRVKDLRTGDLLPDEIVNTTGGVAWANDNETFFYTSKNEETLLSEKVFRHSLGRELSDDQVVYEEKDPSYYIGVYRSKSEEYIIIWNSSTLSNDYYILPANDPMGKFRQFTPREQVHEYSIEHFEDKFYIVTNWNAKNFRLMEVSESDTDKSNWEEVIAHRPDVLLQSIEIFKNFIVLSERMEGLNHLRIINQINQDEHYLEFGETAYVAFISTNPEFDTEWLRFGYSSLTTPFSTYDYHMVTKEMVLKKRQEVVGGHDPEKYHTGRVYATARDGKKVPITLVHRKNFEKNGSGNLLLYGYGSYGATIDPYFNASLLSLLDRGFSYAIAHVRGSQIYGREWYEDGKLFNKKNTFNDFVDCAEFLIRENYTSPDHLFAMGGSAGGLLMGAVVNQAPELFRGVVAAVPFVDVITTMSDPSIPLTSNEYEEWGNPAENLEEYEYIKSYSPYDNITARAYPNMLVTTGFFDSQVQYWEPAKWVARMREYNTGSNRILLHTNMDAGHGGASGRFRRHKETALEYAFMLDLAGIYE
jgi:oligopeptidase B